MPITEREHQEIVSGVNHLIGYTEGMMKAEDELIASHGEYMNKRLKQIYIALTSE